MDLSRISVLLLTVAAFALPAFAAISAFLHARRVIANVDEIAEDFIALRKDWHEASRAVPDDLRQAVNTDYHARFKAKGLPVPSYDNIGTEAFHITATTVRLIFSGNGGNAALALIGLTCGLAASIWSLFLP